MFSDAVLAMVCNWFFTIERAALPATAQSATESVIIKINAIGRVAVNTRAFKPDSLGDGSRFLKWTQKEYL